MRVAYLDEAGISKADEEPYFVVAGVILAPDGQWNQVEGWMRSLVVEYLGEEALPCWGQHYNFHAKDVWHGSGDFPRDKWPLKKRVELFDRISRVPAAFGLPIVYSFKKKADVERLFEGGKLPQNKFPRGVHAAAFVKTAQRIDQWMIENTRNEVIMLIAEDVDSRRRSLIESCHALYVDRGMVRMPGAFQSEMIVEQVSFTKKHQSGILQLADWCAFIIKRRLQKCEKIGPFFDNIKGQIFHRSRDEKSLVTRAPVSSLSLVERLAAPVK